MRGAAVLSFMKEHVHRHAWTPWGRVEVRAAALGDRAAVLGAVPLIANRAGEEQEWDASPTTTSIR